MFHLLATDQAHGLTPMGYLVITGAALLWVTCYVIMCTFFPFAACFHCRDSPGKKFQNARRKAWRHCRWCKGTARRLRFGRRAWAYFQGVKADADS